MAKSTTSPCSMAKPSASSSRPAHSSLLYVQGRRATSTASAHHHTPHIRTSIAFFSGLPNRSCGTIHAPQIAHAGSVRQTGPSVARHGERGRVLPPVGAAIEGGRCRHTSPPLPSLGQTRLTFFTSGGDRATSGRSHSEMANEDDAAWQLDAFYGGAPRTEPSVDRSGIYTDSSGCPVKRRAWHSRKHSQGCLHPERKLLWNSLGIRATALDMRRSVHLAQAVHTCGARGIARSSRPPTPDWSNYGAGLLDIKRRKGPRGRISTDECTKIPRPARVVCWPRRTSRPPTSCSTPPRGVSRRSALRSRMPAWCASGSSTWGKKRLGCCREDSQPLRRVTETGSGPSTRRRSTAARRPFCRTRGSRGTGRSRKNWPGALRRRCHRSRMCGASLSQSQRHRRELPDVLLQLW